MAFGGGCAADILDEVRPRMVQIQVVGQDKNPATDGSGCGTGLVVGPRTLLTARHVLSEAAATNGYRLKLPYGQKLPNGQADMVFSPLEYALVPSKEYPVQVGPQFDVALLEFPKDTFPLGEFKRFGALGERELGDPALKDMVVMSFHDECKGDKDSAPNRTVQRDVTLSPERDIDYNNSITPRIVVGEDLGGGYSGGLVVSQKLGVAVGVYTSGDDTHGYATSLARVPGLFSGGSPEQRNIREVTLSPSRVDVFAEYSFPATGSDSASGFPAANLAVGLRWPRLQLLQSGGARLWATVSIQGTWARWSRTQALVDYPGIGAEDVGSVTEELFTATPSLALRFEYNGLVAMLDGVAGARFGVFMEPETHPQMVYSWVPELTMGYKVDLPQWLGVRGVPNVFSLAPIVGLWWAAASTRPDVADQRFDVLGEKQIAWRSLDLPSAGVRLGLQVTL